MDEQNHENIVIIGTGLEARIALDIYSALDVVVLGILSLPGEMSDANLNDVAVFSEFGSKDAKKVLVDAHVHYFMSIGEIEKRKEFFELAAKITDRPPATAVHPMSIVSVYSKIAHGTMINAGSVINPNVIIGGCTHIHSMVNIDPDAVIGDFCTLSAGVKIGAGVKIAEEVFIGTGAIIYPGVKIGKGAMVGAGSVVIKEVHPEEKVFGNPAQSK